MTTLYKHRLILDLDQTLGPIQATVELHSLDSSAVHRMTTWEPGPFDTPADVLEQLMHEVRSRLGVQEELPHT